MATKTKTTNGAESIETALHTGADVLAHSLIETASVADEPVQRGHEAGKSGGDRRS